MSLNPRLVTVGTVNGGATPIQANVIELGNFAPVYVTLTADYQMLQPDGALQVGFPFRPCFTGAATPQYPHTIPSGTRLALLNCEALALVAAGAGVLS